MKRILIISLAAMAFSACNQASELPPINDGFATKFVLPDPVNLTAEDREYLEQLEKEYEESINNLDK